MFRNNVFYDEYGLKVGLPRLPGTPYVLLEEEEQQAEAVNNNRSHKKRPYKKRKKQQEPAGTTIVLRHVEFMEYLGLNMKHWVEYLVKEIKCHLVVGERIYVRIPNFPEAVTMDFFQDKLIVSGMIEYMKETAGKAMPNLRWKANWSVGRHYGELQMKLWGKNEKNDCVFGCNIYTDKPIGMLTSMGPHCFVHKWEVEGDTLKIEEKMRKEREIRRIKDGLLEMGLACGPWETLESVKDLYEDEIGEFNSFYCYQN